MKAVHEHEFEAAHGLPEALPAGERLLWQGAPDWKALAVDALHARKIAIYFAVLTVWRAAIVASDGGSALQIALGAGTLLGLAAAALGLLCLVAWLMATTAVYTITDKRVVMRVGIVLSVTFNLPFKTIESAALRRLSGAHGNITLVLAEPARIAYLQLWPHVRPWQLKRTQPMLRALPQAAAVAQLLAEALAASAGTATQGVGVERPAERPTERPTERPNAHPANAGGPMVAA